MINQRRRGKLLILAAISLCLAPSAFAVPCVEPGNEELDCAELEQISIVGSATRAAATAGAADYISAQELEKQEYSDVVRALRQIPGVALQVEDGYGLRPNISIRGTATERSGRVTLLEDNVLIAPAPYSAPSAYYFPTFGRIHAMEVLKGPAAVLQGPYTVGGAINLISSPIPTGHSGQLDLEYGTDSTWRVHGRYGTRTDTTGWLLETHQWRSDGFQDIDRTQRDSGFDKSDYLAKFLINSSAEADFYQELLIKLQYSDETSEQSYLGLSDSDFSADPTRRYGLSALDQMQNKHWQITANYRIDLSDQLTLTAIAYHNDFERNWFKTEGIDFDGSANAQDFSRTSWANVIRAINLGESIAGLSAAQLQSILDGETDTAEGSIQLRANDREYYSRGIQFGLNYSFQSGAANHQLEAGVRYHQDQEDRLQRNSTYHQSNGMLLLDDFGLLGNAGNRVQEADAVAIHLYDRISFGRWVFAPGLRYESIDQARTRYETRGSRTSDPASREPGNLRDQRENSTNVLLPGLGVTYDISDSLRLVAGVHKGFTAPTNAPGVKEEESLNYEFGLRYFGSSLSLEAIAFYNNYDNLLGICTSSSGSDCEIGDAFNGDAVSIPGIELSVHNDIQIGHYSMPVAITYTWMSAEFDSDIADTDFFGDVSKGDPVPYIPDHQANISVGLEKNRWASYLSANYVDAVCVMASCNVFEETQSALTFDFATHYQLNAHTRLYGKIENLTDELVIQGRQPYGARPNKSRSMILGVSFTF